MESLFGLPAHPLMVHTPVVLMPLAMLFTLAVAVRPPWRRRFGPALAALATMVLVGTLLAVSSGEAFEELADGLVNVDDHAALGEMTRNFVILFFLATIVMVVFDRIGGDNRPRWADQASWAAVGVSTLASVLATVWMIRTGHEGARSVWDGIVSSIPPSPLI